VAADSVWIALLTHISKTFTEHHFALDHLLRRQIPVDESGTQAETAVITSARSRSETLPKISGVA
jgi:hypothetical protein